MANVKSISYKKLVNLGDYNNESAEILVELDEGDDPYEVLDKCKQFVQAKLHRRTKYSTWDIDRARENLDRFREGTVEYDEAKRIIDEVDAAEEHVVF